MANQYKNKIIFGNQTLMDITDTTATENDVLEGEVFYNASGARSVGTLGDATTTTHGLMSVEDKVKLNNINLLGVKLNITTLTPDANGYVSIPLMTGATSSAAGAAGLVPAPATTDIDKFLAGDGTWKDGGKPMVILSYGNSTWNDFITAYKNNVIVYCRASSNSNPATGSQTRMAFMAYVSNATNPTSVEFQYYRSMSAHSATAMGDEVYIYKLINANGGTWSVTTRKASIGEIAVASGSKLGVSWSSDKVTLSNTMTADDMPMSSSDATTAKAAIESLNSKLTGSWQNFTQAASEGITINNSQFATSGYIVRGGLCFVSLNITLASAQGDTSKAVVNGLPESLKPTIKTPSWGSFGAGSSRINDTAESLLQGGIVYIRNANAGDWSLSFCYPVANP